MYKNYTFKMRVYHEDSDCYGIVHHSNFLRFMERARLEWALATGNDFHRWQDQGVLFVIHSAQLEYIKPARVNDLLEITSTIVERKQASLIYEQIIHAPGQPEQIYCRGRIKVACVNDKMRPRALPEEWQR